MPAITPALSALRLSGRLMVIQNACPRFSRRTLLSVMFPACFLACVPLPADICGRIGADCKQDLSGSGRLPDPDLVVVERGAAKRCDGLRPGQHVDAAPADMGLVRMDRLGD